MIKANKFLLVISFMLAMGCGQQSSGQSEQPAAANTAESAVQQQQVAVLEQEKSPESGVSDLAAAEPVNYVEGTDYERLPTPVPTVDSSKIEVAEVFWYGCSHCYHFEPIFEAWKKNVADDVVVVQSPAMWDKQGIMANHARIYYTAKALGILDLITPAAFREMHVDHNPLRSEESIATMFNENGVSREDFDRTYNSFGVTSAVRQAEARQRGYRIQGTPEVIVNGTYRVSTRLAGGQEEMLKVADFLIDKIRKEKSAE